MKNIVLVILIVSLQPVFGKNYFELSRKIATLREKVEESNNDLGDIRELYSSELRSLTLQKAELEATIRKEEIKNKEMKRKIFLLKAKTKKNGQENNELLPIVITSCEQLISYIESSIPYRKKDRIESVQSIITELNKGDISSQVALSRLWSAFEDERRFTRDNQITKETMEYQNKKFLAEKLKLGTMALYFQLENGVTGKVISENREWKYIAFTEEAEIDAAKKLFDGFKKQIKTGEYLIPSGINL